MSRTRTMDASVRGRAGNGVPQEIAPGVYRVPIGRGLAGVNVYFVRSGPSWVLVDAAWSGREQAIMRAARAVFGPAARPCAILLTHLHPDHSGSAPALARAWDVPVYAHPGELPMATGGVVPEYANPLDRLLIAPLLRLVPPRALARSLARNSLQGLLRPFDPEAAPPGLPDWECLPSPGHTPGHTAFLRPGDGVLIAGDAILPWDLNRPWHLLRATPALYGPPYVSTWDWPLARRSMAALTAREPRLLAAGHGTPLRPAETATINSPSCRVAAPTAGTPRPRSRRARRRARWGRRA